jgi:hypothetical protein
MRIFGKLFRNSNQPDDDYLASGIAATIDAFMQDVRFLATSLAVGLLASGTLAHAGLVRYSAVGGIDVVYDQDSDLTWVADANLFKTQAKSNANIVTNIINAIGSVNDSYYGSHVLETSDFDTGSGRMTWWGAMAWAEWLDYGGATDWRLWSALNADGTGPCMGFTCTDSEFVRLIASSQNNLGIYFDNLERSVYFSSTEGGVDPPVTYAQNAWGYNTAKGLQTIYIKARVSFAFPPANYYAWAVRSGQVVPVPLPGTGWLLGSGFAGLFAASVLRQGRRAMG